MPETVFVLFMSPDNGEEFVLGVYSTLGYAQTQEQIAGRVYTHATFCIKSFTLDLPVHDA